MKKDKYTLQLSIFLLGSSLLLYLINYSIFKDFHHIAVFMTEDLAFIPIDVLVTVLIIDRLLDRRDRKKKIQKINILIEVFFEEVGNELLCELVSKDKNCKEIGCLISQIDDSYEKKFKSLRKSINNYKDDIELGVEDLNRIFELLKNKKDIFIKFLENPLLIEHDTFTDLLQAASHLYNEIKFRNKNAAYSEADLVHLKEDVQRIYKYLSEEWLEYMDYIKNEYPFLFSLAIKNIPFPNK